MGKVPAVSVIIPAYNTAPFMAETLDSVFAQTSTDFEIIVVNDGSPDTSELESVLTPYRDRIVYVRQENRGLAGARNTGIRLARGEFLAFLDSDDCWPAEYLAAQMQLFSNDSGLDLVYSDATLFGSAVLLRKTFMQTAAPPTTLEGLLSEGGQILPSGTVVKKRAIVEAGFFDENLRRVEDYDMWLRLAQREARIAYQPEVRFLRRVHQSALTSDESKMVSSLVCVLTKLKDGGKLPDGARQLLDKQLCQARAELGLMQAKNYLALGDARAAKEALTIAYAYFRSRKIALTLLGLRIAPSATIWGARRFMSAKTRAARDQKH